MLKACLASRSQVLADSVTCQNQLIPLREESTANAHMLADCDAHLAECERRLEPLLAFPQQG